MDIFWNYTLWTLKKFIKKTLINLFKTINLQYYLFFNLFRALYHTDEDEIDEIENLITV